MRHTITRRALVMLALAVLLSSEPAFAAVATWKAGVAKVKITPQEPIWMSGYASRDRPAEGTLHDLWAKAIALEDASGNRIVLLTADLCGIDRGLSIRVRDRLQAEHSLEWKSVALCVSHTHTGPVVGGNLRTMYSLNDSQRQLVEQYTTMLEDHLIAAAGEAIRNLAPARLQWGIGQATFAVNRRNNPEAEVTRLRDAGLLRGPVDYDLPVLSVRDAEGKLRAVVFGYACHATTLSFYHWSNDWPGFAQLALEEKHPGAMALFWAGCGADQNPLPRRSVELASEYGAQAAAGVDRVLAGVMHAVEGELSASYSEIDLPFGDLPTRQKLEEDAGSSDRYVLNRAKLLIESLERDGALASSYPYPIQVWELGSAVNWVLLGGEVVVDYSLRLKRELGDDGATWVAGYANDVMAYIPSRRVLEEGGYEGGGAMVYYGLPSSWAPEVEEIIVREVLRQVRGRSKTNVNGPGAAGAPGAARPQ